MNFKKLLITIILVIITISAFLINNLTSMTLDDCGYALNINNISDIISSQYYDYFIINGRVLSHGIVQFFCGIAGKNMFNYLNALLYTCMVMLIVRHGVNHRSDINHLLIVLLSFVLCWFFLPDQYITTLLIAGSLNYIWATVLVLIFLLLYWNFIIPYKGKSLFVILPIFLISLFSGAFVEMYSIVVLPSLIIWHIVNNIIPNKYACFSLLGFLVGAGFLLLAPGNYFRLSQISGSGNKSIGNMILHFTSNIFNEGFILLFLALIIAWIIFNNPNKELIIKYIKGNIFYISAILFSFFFIFISGAGWSRTFFAVYIFLFILLIKIINTNKLSRIAVVSVYLISIVFLAIDLNKEYISLKNNRKIYNNLVYQLKEKDTNVIFLSGSPIRTRKNNIEILSISASSWKNQGFSAYYNHKSVSCMPKLIHDSLYVSPSIINPKFKECESCYTIPELSYYIIPCQEKNLVEKVTLIYSGKNEIFVPKKQIKRILSIVFLDDYVYSKNKNNILINRVLYKRINSSVTLNPNNFALLKTTHGNYLIVEKENPVTKYGGEKFKLERILII